MFIGLQSMVRTLFHKKRTELTILLSTIIYASAPIFIKLIYTELSVIVTIFWNNFFATLFFLVVCLKERKTFATKQKPWTDILLGGGIIGVLYFGLSFLGLKYTSAGNASIIGLMEVLFSFLFFRFWKNERYDFSEVWGALLMVAGAFLVLFPAKTSFQSGDFIILAAALIPPIGNYFQQNAIRVVGVSLHMLIRSTLSMIFFFILYWIVGGDAVFWPQQTWWLLCINGAFIIGLSKLLFLQGFRTLSVSRAITLGACSPLFTIIFAFLFLHEIPTVWQITGGIPIILGTLLLFRK